MAHFNKLSETDNFGGDYREINQVKKPMACREEADLPFAKV